MIPNPPRRTGKARRSLTSLLQVDWPVSDGMKYVLIFSSNGLKNFRVRDGPLHVCLRVKQD